MTTVSKIKQYTVIWMKGQGESKTMRATYLEFNITLVSIKIMYHNL